MQVPPAAPHTLGLVHTDESSAFAFSAPHLASSPMKPPCLGNYGPTNQCQLQPRTDQFEFTMRSSDNDNDKISTEEAIVKPTLALGFKDSTVMNA